jgi:hypothetical protein
MTTSAEPVSVTGSVARKSHKWNADSYFSIGSTHRVCQDYAAHKAGFAVLSDGCSSAPDTDIGARLLCRNALLQEPVSMFTLVRHAAMIGIPKESLFATLLSVEHIDWGNLIEVRMHGDGHVIAMNENGDLETLHLEYADNMPWYPVYGTLELKTEFRSSVSDSTGIGWENVSSKSREERVFWLKADRYQMVAVCSDGLGTFRDGLGQPVSVEKLARDICSVKVPNGEFLQRRLSALKRNEWANLRHEDDLSIAALIRSTSEDADA